MPVAIIFMINDSMVITFAAFLLIIKKGFHNITGEIITITFGIFYCLFWYYTYSYFVDEVYKMHWKYSKYSNKWYEVIDWQNVFKCKNCVTIRKAFCPMKKDKKSETENVAKEIKIIRSISGFMSSAFSKKANPELDPYYNYPAYMRNNQVGDQNK